MSRSTVARTERAGIEALGFGGMFATFQKAGCLISRDGSVWY